MQLIDLHADTITALYYDMNNFVPEQEFISDKAHVHLAKNNLQVDLDKLRVADSLAQFFVLWLHLDNCKKYKIDPWDHFIKLYNLLVQEVAAHNEQISLVNNLSTLTATAKDHKLAGFVCVEEGAFITKLEDLDEVYQMGVRYITLVWNYETHIGVPSCINQTIGLKKFGMSMVEKMQHLGIMVDVSHLSDAGVKDALSISKKPIIASHSNARTVYNHTRNLPDELIRGIADNGGVVGVSCVPNFLHETDKTIKIARVIDHIKHIHNIAGEDVLALGNDFDGYKCYTPKTDEIKNIADIPKLADALAKANFSQNQIEKIFHANVLRVLATI